MRSRGTGIFVGTALLTLLAAREAYAATATWAATSNANWSDGASWVGGVPPSAGDDLVFPVGPTGVTATNDFPAGAAFGKISIAGEGYVFDGNAIALGGDIAVTSTTTGPTFALPIAITQSITVTSGTPALVTTTFLSGATFDLGPNTLSVAGDGKTSFEGKISGPGGFNRTSGLGHTVFTVDNNYLGATIVNAGTLIINSAKSLGATNTGTTVQGTGSLRISGTGTMTIDEPLVLASSAFASLANMTGTNTWAGPIALDVDSLVAGNAPFTISGTVSGAHVLKLTSNMGITLSGSNTHTGGTTVQSNGITVTQPSALGTGTASTWSNTWITVANGTYPNALSLQGHAPGKGSLRTLAGSTTWSGPIHFISQDTAFENAGALIISGTMGGPGGFLKYGAGELTVAVSGSSYAGGTSINAGTLRCSVASAIPDTSLVQVLGTLAIDAGLSETIGSLTGDGSVALGDGVVLTTGGNGHTTAFSGVISGNAAVVFTGTGTKYLHGVNTYTGATSVNGGTVAIHGSGSIVSASTVATGARLALGNGGTAATITSSGGTVAPGWIQPRTGSSGALVLNGASTFAVGLDGNGAGESTRLGLTGTASLGGATLSITLGSGFSPAIGDAFTIIDNDGADAIDGTFAGLGDSGIIAVGSSYFRVSYVGGDGNDVVLTKVVAPPPDAGVVVDGGSGDGGSTTDAGTTPDAGTPSDAGTTTDAGTSPTTDSGAKAGDGGPSSPDASADSSLGGSGCDCRAATDAPSDAPYGLTLTTLLAIVALARRRAFRT